MVGRHLLAFALAIAIATTVTASIKRDYDPDTNWSAYKTWTFGKGTDAPNDLVQGRINDAIEATMKEKGMTRDEEVGSTGGASTGRHHARSG